MRESKEDINVRKQIIWQFYQDWKKRGPLSKKFFSPTTHPIPRAPTQIHFFIKKKLTFFLANQKKTYICRLKD